MIDIRKKCSSVDPALGLPTFIIFILYLLTVLYFTVLTRPIGLHTAQFELFWSYRAAFAGDFDLGREIIANIAMFVPFGFLASCLLQTYGRLNRRMLIITAIVGMIASLTIEILQLVFMRGLFEWDDVFSNTIGAVVGIIIFYLLLRMKKYSVIIHSISGVFAVICVVVILTGRGITDVEADITPRMFWFEVDGVEITDDQDFDFEDDGSTYIQYQLWTTQMDKLPEKRLENNWLWDNIGGYFEDYELEGNFGPYRVMKRDIPTAYPVTAIETGYYKKGAWIWKEYFRPVR